ncbi:MAG: flagellin [Synergistaceae bacterium]|nr:flagellin [Synergistaceae bacterium]
MVINHNIPALTTYGIVNNTSNSLEKSIQKLSTGLRINSAADDAAGLSISEKMRAQIGGLDRAVANAQDGVSLIQTAEGALTETHSILQRMRELSVQAANDTLTQQDRSYIQEEVDLLRDEIDHIGNTTTFNTKKLLNGDAAVLWSSDNLTTKALVRGGLREIDQFGQKKSFEGNFKISIKADPGTAEVQKTDIFKVKHKTNKYTIEDEDLVTDITAEGLKFDDKNTKYTVASGAITNTGLVAVAGGDNKATSFTSGSISGSATAGTASQFTITLSSLTPGTWDTVNNTAGSTGSATFTISGFLTKDDGTVEEINMTKNVTLGAPQSATDLIGTVTDQTEAISTKARTATGLTFTTAGTTFATAEEGDVGLFSYATASSETGNAAVTVASDGDSLNSVARSYALDTAKVEGKTVELNQLALNTDTGAVTRSKVKVTFGDDVCDDTAGTSKLTGNLATIEQYKIGEVANNMTQLHDIDKFWDSQGNFMLDDPQTITITQGNGKQASVTLYAYDTIKDVETKLNDAIADQLGQKAYVDNDEQFVNYVNVGGKAETTAESVEGTFVIRSAVAGKDGTLRFASKNEDLINALSLNTLQTATESVYTVNITDAHTGESIVSNEKITGNQLIGKLHENIDVEFDAMTGITSKWDDVTKKFTASGKEETTTLHLADNTMTFQIGANEGDDMGINIGDMRSHALGLDSVLVTDRDSASRSITIIDNAIDKVSTQRAKLGAYQNRLEHTMTNLETSSENLSAAESRIRDTDMAKEMMNFTKLNIMLQAGNSMLAQANQLPQNVLSLIR